MKSTKLIMGMPVTVEIADPHPAKAIEEIFGYFRAVDKRFSTYKPASEISRINRGEITEQNFSADMKEIFALAAQTKLQTNGFFDIVTPDDKLDPSGLVKGWAIYKAALMMLKKSYKNFFIDAGGDIQAEGQNQDGQAWRVGIRNPFNKLEIIKVLKLSGQGIATSGNYERGSHIYNPRDPAQKLDEIVSLTVIGPNVYEADRFATAAFAMGPAGIRFIEELGGFEGYMIDKNRMGTQTSGFSKYCI